MLTLESYQQLNGFSVITADELYYVNGGSGIGTGIALMATGVGLMAAGMISADSIPATSVAGAIGAAEGFCFGASVFAYGLGAVTGSYNGNYSSTITDCAKPTVDGVAETIKK